MSEFSIKLLTTEEHTYWNTLVTECHQPTIFHTTGFFEAFEKPVEIFLVKKGATPILGFICSEGKRITLRPDFVPYFGIAIFVDPVKATQYYADTQKAYSILIEQLKNRYKKISVRLAPSVSDIQSFVWSGFEIKLRYTYLVNIEDIEKAYMNLDTNLKRQIRRGYKQEVTIHHNQDVVQYLDLFRATRSKKDNFSALLTRYQQYLQSVNSCSTMAIKNQNGDALAAIFFVWDNQRAYYLLGGYRSSHEDDNQSYTALALWEAMKFTRQQLGLYEFDLEGSMIPGVENFFRKFGGKKVPYYQLWYEQRGVWAQRISSILKRF
ncbi:MAG: GNAT family N-acetyltransferase [Cyclobacteriaceae bacterium]|nr:GNAT family N-acetyltransferase [Cyclobacteriaceae bacterium]UYN85604.1 MAG: GNAT family N-acetyltransferase [Cyclobacteriaceae bacterium]